MFSPIEFAALNWDAATQPTSKTFNDVYYSRHNGLAESRYVFLDGNDLAARWQSLGDNLFVIGETGFGTGLNFLAAWRLWEQTAPPDAHLHYVSVEKFPIQRWDLSRALSHWPELQELSDELIALYPAAPLAGFHRLSFAADRVQLTLIFADAVDGLRQLLASRHPNFQRPSTRGIDAWFLDGFAPAKNPDMWQAPLFDTLACLSTPHATLATFTAAGDVRRGLQAAGFTVQKRAGFGGKREMICARVNAPSTRQLAKPLSTLRNRRTSIHPTPWSVPTQPLHNKSREALVIGAGLAGCHSARALAARGWQVTIVEKNSTIAAESSGNAQGALYSKLSCDDDALGQFSFASLTFALRFYRDYWYEDLRHHDEKDSSCEPLRAADGQSCGVLYLAKSEREALLQQDLRSLFANCDWPRFVGANEASTIAGVPIDAPAMSLPDSGWLNPAALCRRLLDHPNIQLRLNTAVKFLRHDGEYWIAIGDDANTIAAAPSCIIANAQHASQFEQTQHLPLRAIRGQVSHLRDDLRIAALRTVVCGEGYVAPGRGINGEPLNVQSIGATFTLHDDDAVEKERDHRDNLATAMRLLPAASKQLSHVGASQLDGRVGFRCTAPDYLPLVGPVADLQSFVETYSTLRKNARITVAEAGQYLPGLFVNVAHGSRGLAYTPLSAELLAAYLNAEPLPVSSELAAALNPARFIIRDLIRRKI